MSGVPKEVDTYFGNFEYSSSVGDFDDIFLNRVFEFLNSFQNTLSTNTTAIKVAKEIKSIANTEVVSNESELNKDPIYIRDILSTDFLQEMYTTIQEQGADSVTTENLNTSRDAASEWTAVFRTVEKVLSVLKDKMKIAAVGNLKLIRTGATALPYIGSLFGILLASENLIDSSKKLVEQDSKKDYKDIPKQNFKRFYYSLATLGIECAFLATPVSKANFRMAWKGTRYMMNRGLWRLRQISMPLYRIVSSRVHYMIKNSTQLTPYIFFNQDGSLRELPQIMDLVKNYIMDTFLINQSSAIANKAKQVDPFNWVKNTAIGILNYLESEIKFIKNEGYEDIDKQMMNASLKEISNIKSQIKSVSESEVIQFLEPIYNLFESTNLAESIERAYNELSSSVIDAFEELNFDSIQAEIETEFGIDFSELLKQPKNLIHQLVSLVGMLQEHDSVSQAFV